MNGAPVAVRHAILQVGVRWLSHSGYCVTLRDEKWHTINQLNRLKRPIFVVRSRNKAGSSDQRASELHGTSVGEQHPTEHNDAPTMLICLCCLQQQLTR